MAHILVKLDLRKGLEEEMVIEVGRRCYVQCLDYLGIPFHCSRCHIYEYLASECNLKFRGKHWRRKSKVEVGVEVDNDIQISKILRKRGGGLLLMIQWWNQRGRRKVSHKKTRSGIIINRQ